MVIFDLRLFQQELIQQGTPLSDVLDNLGIQQNYNNAVMNDNMLHQQEARELPQQ